MPPEGLKVGPSLSTRWTRVKCSAVTYYHVTGHGAVWQCCYVVQYGSPLVLYSTCTANTWNLCEILCWYFSVLIRTGMLIVGYYCFIDNSEIDQIFLFTFNLLDYLLNSILHVLNIKFPIVVLSLACLKQNFQTSGVQKKVHHYLAENFFFFIKHQCWPAALSKMIILAHCVFEFDTLFQREYNSETVTLRSLIIMFQKREKWMCRKCRLLLKVWTSTTVNVLFH